MNEQNFEYLKDNIKYLGFGEKQNEALEHHLKEGQQSFRLHFNTEISQKPFEARLQFRKSDNSDMYFLNSFEAALQKNNGQRVEQAFYLNKGKGVTAKEAYNLLEGRSVHKELTGKDGQSYKAWIQIDFDKKDKNNNHEIRQFHENYGYDLKASLSKLAITELDGGEKEKNLLHSLQKGNLQSVSIEKDGMVSKMFVEANPQFKSVNLYDAKLQRVPKENMELYLNKEQSAGKAIGKDQKQDIKQETKNKKDQKQEIPPTKKARSQKKGMSA